MIHKQIQHKIHPRLCEHLLETRRPPTGATYVKVARGQTKLPQTNVSQPPTTDTSPHPANELAELKHMMKNLLEQMGTLINLITALFSKSN